jgi:bacillithiol system protein YtxJ
VTEVLHQIRTEAELDRVLDEPVAVLFKHSPYCGMSAAARIEVQQFASSHAEIPVYVVDVVRDRAVSGVAAARTGIKHESPQAILIELGTVAWSASHYRVSCDRLEQAVALRGARAPNG